MTFELFSCAFLVITLVYSIFISLQHVHLVVMGRTVCLTVTVEAARVIQRMENVCAKLGEWGTIVNRVSIENVDQCEQGKLREWGIMETWKQATLQPHMPSAV